MIPAWMRSKPVEVTVTKPKTNFADVPADKFTSIVNSTAKSNVDREYEALQRADIGSFWAAHPELANSEKNVKLINHYLTSQGIDLNRALFPDFQAAYDFLVPQGVLSIDESENVQRLDNPTRTLKGSITGRKYTSVDSMLLEERHAAVRKLPTPSQEQIDFENLPLEEFQARVKQAERDEQIRAKVPQVQKHADAFLSIRPEIVDSERNGKLINMQLRANGITPGNETVADFDRATNQLRESGLLTLNKTQLDKQRSAEVKQIADEALAEPGGPFDITAEDAMYNLDMEELRKRAERQLARR